MKKLLQVLLLAGFAAVCANAQFTVTISTDGDSDDSTAWASLSMEYAPDYGCTMCVTAGHTYTGSVEIDSDQGGSNSCNYSQSAAGSQTVYLGCETTFAVAAGETLTAFVSLKNICSMIGTFAAITRVTTTLFTYSLSSYQTTNLPCTPTSGGSILVSCEVVPYGTGCPGKCTTATSLQIWGTPLLYWQCIDVSQNGACKRTFCETQSTPGRCSQ